MLLFLGPNCRDACAHMTRLPGEPRPRTPGGGGSSRPSLSQPPIQQQCHPEATNSFRFSCFSLFLSFSSEGGIAARAELSRPDNKCVASKFCSVSEEGAAVAGVSPSRSAHKGQGPPPLTGWWLDRRCVIRSPSRRLQLSAPLPSSHWLCSSAGSLQRLV